MMYLNTFLDPGVRASDTARLTVIGSTTDFACLSFQFLWALQRGHLKLDILLWDSPWGLKLEAGFFPLSVTVFVLYTAQVDGE